MFSYLCCVRRIHCTGLYSLYVLYSVISAIFGLILYTRNLRQFRHMRPNQLYVAYVPFPLHKTIFAVFPDVSYFCSIQPYSAMFASLLDLGRSFLQMAGPPKLLCARLCAGLCAALCGPFCAQVPLGAGWPPVSLTFVCGH